MLRRYVVSKPVGGGQMNRDKNYIRFSALSVAWPVMAEFGGGLPESEDWSVQGKLWREKIHDWKLLRFFNFIF